jgi:hypothetical protein
MGNKMGLLPEKQPPTQTTPAARLQKKFSKVSLLPRSSKTATFRKLLETVPYDEIDSVLTWLGKQPEEMRRITCWTFSNNYSNYLYKKKNDLNDYPASAEAVKIASVVACNADFIEAGYIQHTIDAYTDFIQYLKEQPEEVAKVVYDQLPPPNDFALLWYAKIVPNYSSKFRMFAVLHPKFQQLLLKLSGDGTRAIVKIVVRYDESFASRVRKAPSIQ